jgi:hypothetical protein
MSNILSELKLSVDSDFDGLIQVKEKLSAKIPLSEQRIIQEIQEISTDIDFVFFRRFKTKNDIRTSQAVACIVDNTKKRLSKAKLAYLHHSLWLNGTIPLLYIDNNDKVDIFSCVAGNVSRKRSKWVYAPFDSIYETLSNINDQIKIKQIKRFSAVRLADGTFWEDKSNKEYIDIKKSAHNVLLEKIKLADRKIEGNKNPIARRLLLITLLIKYLEDRGVFKTEKNFFSKYSDNAESFYDVLKNGTIKNIEALFEKLESKFNGDIFILHKNKHITKEMVKNIVDIVKKDIDSDGQLYFWDIYNFKHIPVEVISHIYQYFTEKGQGAVFTPILLVNLMLDQVMPLEGLQGDEKICDPTCGSGIFLVSAFRRLIYKNKKKDDDWLTPDSLTSLLKNTIYGIELHEEAAQIASFSLALAVCDALKPDIIWNKLQFRKMIGHNIFIGDFGEKGKKALNAIKPKNGFDIILGNPPFLEELTEPMSKDLLDNNKKIPSNQVAYYVLETCIDRYLSDSGKICMIQPSGFLYNINSAKWRSEIFKKYTVDRVLDFISIDNLFFGANPKAIAIQARKKKPLNKNMINHFTFRRKVSINEKICFELDRYDYNQIPQKDAVNDRYPWKANLLGGGRLVQLAKRIAEFPTIQDYITKKKWLNREGYMVGEQKKDIKRPRKMKKRPEKEDWLYNQLLLVPEALTFEGIDKKQLGRVRSEYFLWPRKPEIYNPPLIIIEERESLKSGFWNEGFLAYTSEFIGIKAKPEEEPELIKFYNWFKDNNGILRACLHLIGGRMLTVMSTATQEGDITNLPYPKDYDFNLSTWEKELLDDVNNYMAEYVRVGQDSKLLINTPSKDDIHNYLQTFLHQMNSLYPKMANCRNIQNDDFRLTAFSFYGDMDILQELDNANALDNPSMLIPKEQSEFLRTQRVVRILTGDAIIIVKPNKLRYWIKSTAIRDADDLIKEIFKGGK